MATPLQEVISRASLQDRIVLASVLGTDEADSASLRMRLHSASKNIWQKAFNSEVPYWELLDKVGSAHGMRRRILESYRDFERRIVRSIFKQAIDAMPSGERREYLARYRKEVKTKLSLVAEGSSAASIVAAQASGFGVYQMATTVLGMASSAAGVTIPFIGYMVLTKSIFFLIGPLGWIGLGASTVHKLTKPNYAGLVAVVAWMFQIRSQVEPQITFLDYSLTEIARKIFKISLPLLIAAWMLGFFPHNHTHTQNTESPINSSSIEPLSLNAPTVTSSPVTAAISTALPGSTYAPLTPREAALAKSLGSNNLTWKSATYSNEGNTQHDVVLKASILLDAELRQLADESTIHLLVTRSDPGTVEENTCGACETLLSAYTYKVSRGQWSGLAANQSLEFVGSFISTDSLAVVHLAKSIDGLIVHEERLHMGEGSDVITLYTLSDRSIKEALTDTFKPDAEPSIEPVENPDGGAQLKITSGSNSELCTFVRDHYVCVERSVALNER